MTGEAAEKTTPWCEQNGVEYPYAYDASGELFKQLGCKGYPSAVLVDPKGKVAWSGHPMDLTSGIIEKNIAGADKTPVAVKAVSKGWPESAQSVKKLLAKQQFGKAIATANKLAADDPACKVVVDSLVKLVDAKVAAVKLLKTNGDYLGVLEAVKEAKASLDGLPQGGEIAAIAKEVAGDANASKILKAQKSVHAVKATFAKIKKQKDVDSRIQRLRKIAAKNAGNVAGTTAEKLIADLEKRREALTR